MSGRLSRSDPREGRQPPLRLLGDPGVCAALRSATQGVDALLGSVRRSEPASGLDVYASRRRCDEEALCAARGSAQRGRGFLLVEIEWGRAAVGPLVRPVRGDACLGCLYTRLTREREATPTPDEVMRSELVPLPGLVAAIAAREIAGFLGDADSSLTNARLLITPFAGWSAARAPGWVRIPVPRVAGCTLCGVAAPQSEAERWAWLTEGAARNPTGKRDNPAALFVPERRPV